MGLWSWLFPSPEQRLERARQMVADGRAEFARLEVLDLTIPGAREVQVAAETELCKRNLEAALQYGRQGDDDRAEEALELAEQFHHGGLDEQFTNTRRELRETRSARDAAEERAKSEKNARLMAVDPLGLGGGPSWLDPVSDGTAFDPSAEERAARLALVIENYPPSLKAGVGTLGASFAEAVLALDEGRPDEALQLLVALPDDQPLVQWERARAAVALGDPAAAAGALRSFARLANGHHPVGNNHSGVFLAQLLTETGDVSGALRVLRDLRATDPNVGGFLYAQLLHATGALPEAEQVLVQLVRKHPGEPPLYALLAEVRLAGGHRPQAMRALEAGLEACGCGTPGKCGSKPPDLHTHRLLATLYLEDGLHTPRALELAATAASLAAQPSWDDVYLRALVARTSGDPSAVDLARRLAANTPAEHPGTERLTKYLPVA
ncbi:MAG: hypothetical protein ABMA64_26785 [Myxococcota bacterium]